MWCGYARTNSYIGGLLGCFIYHMKELLYQPLDAQLLPSGYRVPASAIV